MLYLWKTGPPCPVCGRGEANYTSNIRPDDPSVEGLTPPFHASIVVDSPDSEERSRIHRGESWSMEIIRWRGDVLVHIPFSHTSGCNIIPVSWVDIPARYRKYLLPVDEDDFSIDAG